MRNLRLDDGIVGAGAGGARAENGRLRSVSDEPGEGWRRLPLLLTS